MAEKSPSDPLPLTHILYRRMVRNYLVMTGLGGGGGGGGGLIKPKLNTESLPIQN